MARIPDLSIMIEKEEDKIGKAALTFQFFCVSPRMTNKLPLASLILVTSPAPSSAQSALALGVKMKVRSAPKDRLAMTYRCESRK
jgi:hypothetical protein